MFQCPKSSASSLTFICLYCLVDMIRLIDEGRELMSNISSGGAGMRLLVGTGFGESMLSNSTINQ
jgi:ActR/RegA family two-component response regulator